MRTSDRSSPLARSLEGVLRMLAPEMIAELVIANMDFLPP